MKTISIVTVVILFFLISCAEKAETNTPKEDIKPTTTSSREVVSDSAQNVMGAYQVWRSMSPGGVTWNPDDSTLTFTVKKLTNEDALLVTKINELAEIYADVDPHARNGSSINMPYTFSDREAQSFYIDKADINIIEEKTKGTNTGYRAYLAMEYDPNSNSQGLTHLFIGPANKDGDGNYTDPPITNSAGKRIFMDLILPCPNGCPSGVSFGSQIGDFHPLKYFSGK